jgi:hypothetical protein
MTITAEALKSTSPAPPVDLQYRVCGDRDVDTLKAMRRECGWGEDRVWLYLLFLSPMHGLEVLKF